MFHVVLVNVHLAALMTGCNSKAGTDHRAQFAIIQDPVVFVGQARQKSFGVNEIFRVLRLIGCASTHYCMLWIFLQKNLSSKKRLSDLPLPALL